MEEQILVQSDNNYEFVKFAASPMGHGHVLNLNKWIYKVDGIVLASKVRSVLPGGHSRGIEGEKKEELPPVNKQDDSARESSHGNGGSQKIKRVNRRTI